MQIRVLGPLEVVDDRGEVLRSSTRRALAQPSRPQVQRLLALLAFKHDTVHPIDRIYDVVWGPDDSTAGRNRNGVEKAILEIRDLIERAGHDRDAHLVNTSDGYELRLGGSIGIDVVDFRHLVESAKRREPLADKVRELDSALALWRGDPPAALRVSQAGTALWNEIRELRADAELARVEARVKESGWMSVVDHLGPLVSDFPTDERFLSRRIRALSESGKALQAVGEFEWYQEMIADLGVEPGEEVLAAYRHAKGARPSARAERVTDSEILSSYLGRVIRSSGRLRFGDATAAPHDGGSFGSMTLDRVWTPLTVALSPLDSERVDSRTEELDVLEALSMREHRHVVLLGRPGGGKSTVVAYRTHQLALEALRDNGDGIVPVHVRLPTMGADPLHPTVDSIWSGVNEVRTEDGVDDRLVALLRERVRLGRAVILFDGLDEVQEERLEGVLAVVQLCCSAFVDVGIVVTCRTFDYSAETPRRKLPLPTLQLLPFELPQQLAYVKQWYDALGQFDSAPSLPERKANLQRTITDTPALFEMGRTPLLLALMTLVHTQDGELPAARASLYRRTIGYLLAETAMWRENSGGSTIASQQVLLLAARVGFEYHKAQEFAVDEFRGLSERAIFDICAEVFRLYSTPIGSLARSELERTVRDHVLRLIQSNGLLLEQGGGTYDFAFKQYREFLAGLHVGTMVHEPMALELAARPHWHECFQLLASHEATQSTNIVLVLHFIDELANTEREEPAYSPADAVLAAEMFAEIGRERLLVFNQERVLTPSPRRSGLNGLWNRVIDMLLSLLDNEEQYHARSLRLRAGFALGVLGDPRIVSVQGIPTPLADRLVPLKSRSLSVGTKAPQGSGRRKLDAVGAGPRQITIDEFSIGRYPVTNREFQAFIDDGGYGDQRWWRITEGSAWRAGDADFIDRLEALWVDTAEENYAKELQEGYYTIEKLEATATELCRTRDKPYFFANGRFNAPNQPVVGVNFWEALAYCAWLTQLGHREGWLASECSARLPTEWEWEYASGNGAQTVYPWGDEWDPERCRNRYDGTPYNQASPVGCYPEGGWAGGPSDMAGNVWEWTSSRLSAYASEEDERREDPSGLMERAIRGSSWYDRDAIANTRRVARYLDLPGNVYFDLGFRVAVGRDK